MKLSIKNFAKIKEAEILIDGITVIAGENNTGKSTVGKILFSVFNSLSNIDEKIYEERFKEIKNTNATIIQNYMVYKKRIRRVFSISMEANRIAGRINNKLEERAVGFDVDDENLLSEIKNIISTYIKMEEDETNDGVLELSEEIYKNTREILNLSEKQLALEIVSRYFRKVFHSQINSLSNKEDKENEILLKIKDEEIKIGFEKNRCNNLEDNIKIIHKAIYIDNPFIIDQLTNIDLHPTDEELINILTEKRLEGIMDGLIESVRAKEKLEDVYKTLDNVVDGEISINPNDNEYYLQNSEFEEPISFHNLSAGMKSFVILKMLLEEGKLQEKDVLILDEPEIHLHPQWQIVYAELIVLLQKQFDLSVIVTSHSPYFVDAINLFSCKHKIGDKVNYYLSSSYKNIVTMKTVTNNINEIYEEMASPIQMLDTLRYELNNQ